MIKINQCRWLSTSQLKRYFFADTTTRAINKRLNILVRAGYLSCKRLSYVHEYYFKLGSKGRQFLFENTELSFDEVIVPKRFPKQLSHFSRINDLRWYTENSLDQVGGKLQFFLIDYDLKGLLNGSPIIPDILMSFEFINSEKIISIKSAIEYDSGTENPQYFGMDKIKKYYELVNSGKLLFNTPDLRLMVFAETRKRIIQLVRYSLNYINPGLKILFCAMEDLEISNSLFNVLFINPQMFTADANFMCRLYE